MDEVPTSGTGRYESSPWSWSMPKHCCRQLGGKILEDLDEIERLAASEWADLGKVERYAALKVEPSQLIFISQRHF